MAVPFNTKMTLRHLLAQVSTSRAETLLNPLNSNCTRCAIENKNTPRSQIMEPGASNNPPDPH
eukprot:1157669-Pelagomonas_calceolata.AAC.11